jgi:hypothetical protein
VTALEINADHVVQVSRILIKSRNAADAIQGRMLLAMACRAGSRVAVVWNLKLAQNQGQFHHNNLKAEREQLLQIVKEGTYVPALVLQANIFHSAGNIAGAMKLWTRATQLQDDTSLKQADESGLLGFEETILSDLDVCSAWIAIAQERMDIHSDFLDFDLGKEAYRVAAIEYDDPYAYHHLALTEDLYSPLWIQYHTKAAVSGHMSSASALGDFYFLSRTELDSHMQEFADPADRDATLDAYLANPLDGLKLQTMVTEQNAILHEARGLPPVRFGATRAERNESKETEEVIRRNLYALVWYGVASRDNIGYTHLKIARIYWSCGWFSEALRFVKYVRTADFSTAGDEESNFNQDAEALFREFQKAPIWSFVYENDERVRALHAEISALTKFTRQPAEWGFRTRNPALARMETKGEDKKDPASKA